MQLKPEYVAQHLLKGLAPVYLISGDEPQQCGEMADAVRMATRKSGFDTREILSVDAGFEWNSLAFSAGSLSIFSDKKIIDLRLTGASPGTEGSKALVAYCERPPEDTVLLVTTGKLTTDSKKSRWFQAIDNIGVIIQVWPLEGQELIRWIEQRLHRRGLRTDSEAARLLAEKVEGNLLAAAQEIEKLYILYGSGVLNCQQIIDAVGDNARFDVFKLVDSALSADIPRILKIISALQSEGVASAIVLWAVAREARTLIKIKQALAGGQNKESVYKKNQIWDKRQQLVNNAIRRLEFSALYKILELSAQADRQIKGQNTGDPWETVLGICLVFASVKAVAVLS